MTSRSIRIAISLTVVLAALLSMLSCGGGLQNTNLGQTQNGNHANAVTVGGSDDPCEPTNARDKKEKLKKKVVDKIDKDPVLKKQYHGYQHYPANYQDKPPRFSFEVVDGTEGAVEIHFKGDVSGEGKLEALVDFLDSYKKKGCLERVKLSPGPARSKDGALRSDGFEWNFCEWPTIPCPGGRCGSDPCVALGNGNTSTNSNTNSSSNRENMNK